MQDSPPPFRRTPSGAIELRQGGGWLALAGAPFLIGGIIMALGSLRVIPLKDEFGHPFGPYLSLVSVVLFVIAAVMVFGRRSLVIDPATGSLTRSTSVIVILRTRTRAIGEFNAVVISLVRGDSDSPDTFPVRLRALAGKDYTISAPSSFADARQQAAFLAETLRFPLVDATTEHETVLPPDHADDTLQQRLRTEPATARGPLPSAMRTMINELPGQTVLTIPLQRSRIAGAIAGLMGLFMLAIAAPALWHMLERSGTPLAVKLGFTVFLAFFFGILPLLSAGAAFGILEKKVVVTASSSGVIIERRGIRGARRETVAASDILDIDYSTLQGTTNARRPRVAALLAALGANKGIVLKSRKGIVAVGERLAPDEMQYLVWILKKSLSR